MSDERAGSKPDYFKDFPEEFEERDGTVRSTYRRDRARELAEQRERARESDPETTESDTDPKS